MGDAAGDGIVTSVAATLPSITVGSNRGTVQVWRLVPRHESSGGLTPMLQRIVHNAHRGGVTASFASDPDWVFTGGGGGTVKCWTTRPPRTASKPAASAVFAGNLAQVDALFVHGSLLVCGSADHHINLFDAYTSVRTAAFTAGDGVEGVWAGERGLVASCGVSTVQLWDSTASDSRRGAVRTFSTCGAGAGNVHTGFGATDCRLVGDDERFVVVASATGTVLRLDTRAGGSTTTVPHLRRSTGAWDVLHTPHDDDARRVRGCKLIGESHAMYYCQHSVGHRRVAFVGSPWSHSATDAPVWKETAALHTTRAVEPGVMCVDESACCVAVGLVGRAVRVWRLPWRKALARRW